MCDHLTAEAPADVSAYASLEELKTEHSTLLRRRRGGFDADRSTVLGEIETFLRRGYATGKVLGDEAERYSAQSLLTYWSNVLYREGREIPDDTLTEYDPGQAPELDDTDCPYDLPNQASDGESLRSPGWSRLIDESVKAIERDRFLAVVGAVGSGRRTLIRLGILPALQNGAIEGSNDWRFLPAMVPGADPLSELLRHLHPEADSTWIESNLAALRANPAGLAGLHGEGDERPAVLVIERFGELFDQRDRTQIRPFAEAMLALAQDLDSRHIIILGTRPDNLSLMSAIGGFGKLFQRNQVLMSFTNRELRQMVEEPAKRVGLKFDDGVVDRLLLDVQGDPAVLSLLGFNLRLLWNHRQGNRITHEIYDNMGGGRLALAGQAERIYASLSPEQQRAVKLAFLKLVRLEGGGRVVCLRVPRSQLEVPEIPSGVMNAALDRLLDGEILIRKEETKTGESGFRLVHEAAATAWPRCVEWLDEFRARHRWQLGLQTAAEQWRDKDQNTGALWRGGALEQAREERARFLAAGGELSRLEEDFLEASQAAERRWTWIQRGLIISAVAGVCLIAGLYSKKAAAEREAAEANEARAKAEGAIEKAKASFAIERAAHEKQSRQDVELAMAHRSIDEATRLDDSESDASGSLLWMGDAWKRLEQNADALSERGDQEYLRKDYLIRLGIAERGLPRISTLLPHEDLIASAVSDDRRFAASVSSDGSVRYWRLANGTSEQWPLTEVQKPIDKASVSISPAGNYVVVCTGDARVPGRAFIRDIAAGTLVSLPHDQRVTMAAFCNRARELVLVTACEPTTGTGEIRLWKEGTWELLRKETLGALGTVKHIAFTQELGRLAVVGKNEKTGRGFCREWSLDQPGSPREYPIPAGYPHVGGANYAAYSPDGKYLAIACGEEGDDRAYACLFNVSDSFLPRYLPHRGGVIQLSFSPDGKKLVTASDDGTAKVWVLHDGSMASPEKTLNHGSSVFSAEFSPDSQYVATASRDLRARVWDAETGDPVSSPLQHSGSVDYARFTSDGRQLLTQSPNMLHLWDLSSGVAPSFQFAGPSSIDHECWDPKTLRVAAAGYEASRSQGWAAVWDGKTGKQLTPELAHPGRVTGLALSPRGGQFLVTACDDLLLRVWKLASGQQTCDPIPISTDQLRFVTFSPDGSRLVIAGADGPSRRGAARVYSVSPEGKLAVEKLEPKHGAPIHLVVFNPGGDRFVTLTGTSDAERGEATIWDRSGSSIELKGKQGSAHPQGILSAAFSRDGQLLITTSFDNTARVWKVSDGSLVRALEAHTADVVSASFSDSGEYIATSSKDRTAIVWKLDAGNPIAVLSHKNQVNLAVFTDDPRYLVTACRDGAARIWSSRGGGRLVAIRRQSGRILEIGYTGGDPANKIGIFSVRSPAQSSGTETAVVDSRPSSQSLDYRVEVGVWDVSPITETAVEPLVRIGEVAAARRIGQSFGEVDLEPIPPTELLDTWKKLPQITELQAQQPTASVWHDRMAAGCESRRHWAAAAWHLERLAAEPGDLIATYLRKARAYGELGRTDKRPDSLNLALALENLNRVLEAQPDNGPVYLDRAEIQFDRENWDESVKDYTKAEQLVGGSKRVWTGRARARSKQQHWQPAIEDYLKVLQANPGDGSVHGQLAESYFNARDWKKAIEHFSLAAQKLPKELGFRSRRAAALGELKENAQAIKEYAEVAVLYRRQAQFKNAIEAYRSALELKPEKDAGRLRWELGETLAMAGRRDEAIVEYKEALNCEPANWRYWRGLAGLQEATEAWAEAKSAYSRAIALSPHESTLLRGRARVLRHLKEWDLAAHDYKTAAELNPTDHWLKMELAELYIEADKLDEAVVCFEQIAKASSNDVMPHLRVATIQLMRGDCLGYKTTCERLLGRFEQVKSVLTANTAAWACALGPDALKDMGRAVRLAEWVVNAQPNNASYRDTLGAVYYRAGDMKATIKELSESKRPAAPWNSFRPVLTVVYDRLFLAMALYRSKRVQEAQELLETAIEQLDTMGRNRNGALPPHAIDPWQKRELSLLRKEAETLIKPKR